MNDSINPVINVEEGLANVVRSMGGLVLEDSYGTSLPFKNSDYYFPSIGVAAELKRLVLDQESDPLAQGKIQAKFRQWIEDGTIGPVYGKVVVDSKTLPEKCQIELLDCFSGPLRKRISKANKQLKETLDHFNPTEPKGLLFIVNDGNYSLSPDIARHLIRRILGNDYSKINSVVYMTANLLGSSPLTERNVLVWAHMTRKAVVQPVDTQFVMSLYDAWHQHVEMARGEPIERISIDNLEQAEIKNRAQT